MLVLPLKLSLYPILCTRVKVVPTIVWMIVVTAKYLSLLLPASIANSLFPIKSSNLYKYKELGYLPALKPFCYLTLPME